MPRRDYDFPLPHHFSKWQVMFAPSRLQAAGIWDKLPRYMRQEIMEAYYKQVGYTLTEDDLNNINDDVWEQVRQLFLS